MAKKRSKKRAAKKRGGSQRAKFKKVAASCRAEVQRSDVKPMSPAMWKKYGSCMKKGL